MSEFKSISDILKQFSSKQKFKVLIILLSTTILISLGTTFISNYYKTPEESGYIIESQKKTILGLNNRINYLQNSLIQESQSCTDSILSKEKRHMEEMLKQQKYVDSMLNILKHQLRNRRTNNTIDAIEITHPMVRSRIDSIGYDSMVVEPVVQPKIIQPISEPNNDKEILNTISTIQKKIKKH